MTQPPAVPPDRPAPPPVTIEVFPGDPIEDADASGIDVVLQAGFGGWPRAELAASPVEHLRWKALGPTEAGTDICLIRLESGQIIGAQVLFTRRYRWHGRELHVIEGVDAVLHPDEQGKGYSSQRSRKLLSEYEPAFDLAMSFASNPIMIGTRIRRGSRQPANDVHQLTRVLSVRDAFIGGTSGRRRRSVALRTAGLIAFRAWAALRPRLNRVPTTTATIREVERFDDRVDALFDTFAKPFDFIQVRDQRALNWRYADPRGGDYHIAIAEAGDGRLLGYVVYRTSFNRGFLMDLITDPTAQDVAAALIEHATDRLRALGATSITTWVQAEHPHRGTYRRQGFLDTRSNPGFALRAIRMDPADLEPLYAPGTRIHVTLGDADFL